MARLARGSCAGWPRCGSARWRSGATASTCARRGLDITCPTRSERDIADEAGTWHLASKGAVSRREMARIFPMGIEDEQPAERLVMLGSERALLMPSLIEALERHEELMAQSCSGVAA